MMKVVAISQWTYRISKTLIMVVFKWFFFSIEILIYFLSKAQKNACYTVCRILLFTKLFLLVPTEKDKITLHELTHVAADIFVDNKINTSVG